MKQSRIMSMVEATTNVVVGYGVPVATQNLKIGVAVTIVSLAKSCVLRRLFAAGRMRRDLDSNARPVGRCGSPQRLGNSVIILGKSAVTQAGGERHCHILKT